jgi:hypothetical protein
MLHLACVAAKKGAHTYYYHHLLPARGELPGVRWIVYPRAPQLHQRECSPISRGKGYCSPYASTLVSPQRRTHQSEYLKKPERARGSLPGAPARLSLRSKQPGYCLSVPRSAKSKSSWLGRGKRAKKEPRKMLGSD